MLFRILWVGCFTVGLVGAFPQQSAPQDALNQFGYEDIGGGKYAVVVSGYNTWSGAQSSCSSHLSGATLFTVNNAQDSNWLGKRINIEKDFVNGASKFWVGLTSLSASGPLQWIDGTAYQHYPEVVQADGFDDSSKRYAWAVPDSGSRLKYEFLTAGDEAEAFVCQYVL